jgi:molybdenum cofactor synthesis domain-containing protein
MATDPITMLREVRVEAAIGMVLAHDLTQIIPGQFKGRLFKKGHVIREEDIPHLLNIGKEHIYVLDLQSGWVHEDEAAERMARAVQGENIEMSEPREGKVTLKTTIYGLAKVDKTFVDAVNAIDQIVMSTIRNDTVVHPGQELAGTRVIPLVVEEAKVAEVERAAMRAAAVSGARQNVERSGADASTWSDGDSDADRAIGPAKKPIYVKPFRELKVGLTTTGGEVYSGRIEDKFGPVVKKKVADLGSVVTEQRFAPDDMEKIIAEIRYFREREVDLILLTGGMSVDPDDRTPGAIKRSGADIVSYGTPMLPGSMLLVAYLGGTPIMGLPGCVMHDPFTSFDVLLPRICAGERIERSDIVAMGYGGLLGC